MRESIKKLDKRDLEFYKLYQEKYYKDSYKNGFKLNIYDIVRISDDITHDRGYAGQYGVIIGYCMDSYYYVMAYNSRNDRYWVCGFTQDKLTRTSKKINDIKELHYNMEDYLIKNQFNISTRHFKEMWHKHKDGKGNINKYEWATVSIVTVLFPEDQVKIDNAVIKYPLGSYQMGEIARLSGLLQQEGVSVLALLKKECVKRNIDTTE